MSIDKDAIAEQLGCTRDDIDMLLTMFHNNANSSLEEMKKMIELKDMQGIVDTAHAISGGAGTLRLDDIYQLSKKIEMAAKTGQNLDYQASYNRLNTLVEMI